MEVEISETPAYHHLFAEAPEAPWTRLASDKALSVFRDRYWGRDIVEDKGEWVEAQNTGHPIDTEEPPANFAFHCTITGLNMPVLWVREDYVLLYNECTARFNRTRTKSRAKPPSVIITGQPGIGKSFWIFYAVRRRLGEMLPFVWYFRQGWYLFVEDGVFRCVDRDQFSPAPFRREANVWALVDADNSTQAPPILADYQSNLHTIFTTSPREERWNKLGRTTSSSKVIMNPWTWDEIYQAAMASDFTQDDIQTAERAFYELGPTARLCIDYVEDPLQLETFKARRRMVLNDLSMSGLVEAVRDCSSLEMDASHTIFLMRRVEELKPGDEGYLQRFTIEAMTDHVRQELKRRLMKEWQDERLRLYRTFATVPESRPVAGIAFEAIGQSQLQKQVALTLVPMVRHPPTGRLRLARWKSQVADELVPMSTEGSSSGSVGAIARHGQLSVSFKPDKIFQFKKNILSNLLPGVFYVPMSSKQAGFDSFMVVDGVLYIFQVTIALEHSIKGGLADFFSKESFQSVLRGKEWRFIFVIPQGGDIQCSESTDARMKKFWKDAKLFSAEIDPAEQEQG